MFRFFPTLIFLSICLLIVLTAIFYLFLVREKFNLILIAAGFPFLVIGLLLIFFAFSSAPKNKISLLPKIWSLRKLWFGSSLIKENKFLLHSLLEAQEELRCQKNLALDLRNKINSRGNSAEAFSWSVIDSLPSGLIAFDTAGWAKIVNQPAQQIFELQPDNLVQVNYQTLFQSAPQILHLIRDSLEHHRVTLRLEADYAKADKIKRLGITIAPLIVAGNVNGVLCLLSDISAIVKMREQIAVQNNLENLGLMSAGLAHEFKNVLASINCTAQFIDRRTQPPEIPVKSAARLLTAETNRLSEMVGKFLDFANPQKLEIKNISLENLIADCLAELQQLSVDLQVSIEIKTQPLIVRADWLLLRQALLNILRNAVEAAANRDDAEPATHQTPTVWVNFSRIAKNNKESAVVTITDTGGGIDQSNLEKIFVPFFSTKEKGHGLGLALAHQIITQHGGSLNADNSLIYGAIFEVELQLSDNHIGGEFT